MSILGSVTPTNHLWKCNTHRWKTCYTIFPQMQIFHIVHSAHQSYKHDCLASVLVHWPGINTSIQNTWYTCLSCNEIAPLTSKEQNPIITTWMAISANLCRSLPTKWQLIINLIDQINGYIHAYHFQLHHNSENSGTYFYIQVTISSIWHSRRD